MGLTGGAPLPGAGPSIAGGALARPVRAGDGRDAVDLDDHDLAGTVL